MPLVIADDFKERVRSQTDIVGLVSESVALTPQRGGREFVGLCPFHDDHNPSMRVYADRQSFRCWSCNVGGDCFAFVMQRERIGFREALEMLAERAHLELPRAYRAPSAPDKENKNRQYEILAWAEQQFHECLLQDALGERARKYLRERGISGESIVRFKLGYHPDDWQWLLGRARNRFTAEQLAAVRLTGERDGGGGYFDYFVDRVLFPIHDAQGRAVAFGGRELPDAKPTSMGKYWNSPDGPLFNKSRLLYGLDIARDAIAKSAAVVVVEGYTDCIMAHQHGLTNFVATLGTALNENHVIGIKRFARKVVLVFDGDGPGRAAAERSLPRFLPHEIDLRLLTPPGGLDPAEFLLAHGGEALRHLLESAPEAWDAKLRLVIERHGLDTIDARHRVLDEMLGVLAEVPQLAGAGLAGQWQERENIVVGQLAHRLKIAERFVRTRLHDLRVNVQQRKGVSSHEVAAAEAAAASPAQPPLPRQAAPLSGAERTEWWLLATIFNMPEQMESLAREIHPEDLSQPHLRQLYEICLGLWNEGHAPSYDRVTNRLEEPEMKSLAAQIDEQARRVGQADPQAAGYIASFPNYFRKRRAQRPPGPALGGPHGLDPPAATDAKTRLAQARERHRQLKSTR